MRRIMRLDLKTAAEYINLLFFLYVFFKKAIISNGGIKFRGWDFAGKMKEDGEKRYTKAFSVGSM